MTPLETTMYYAYVLQSKKDGKWYTGATSDLRKRLSEHNANLVSSTKGRSPLEIIYFEACLNEHDAFVREKYLKSGMGKRYLKNRLKRFLSLTGRVHSVRGRLPSATATSNGGFVALMTVIVISVILLTVAIGLNQAGFLTRSQILDAEYKERSSALAEACVDTALLRFAEDSGYTGPETINNIGSNTGTCQIRPVKKDFPVSGQTTIETQAFYNEAVTDLSIVIDTVSLTILSWLEVPQF
ncbi:MAG: hypothetical protein A3A80_00250 [Candidatus Terrybacteria bacterium RIFCSPLOWO2_01_FULL_44_24]|uniref:GIY-YIG domain-containing protein n=1 Tax=Candidatus Terrybacteria bacterium RIFCSPHIGHO2_01_FULL_43_35 TaxID=1802361 RepID=A0A1G2PCA0_9BACT|nr:MAG: hypothetical protein A2828_01020 [Candidatus Terrybacteria bacterium RIFCSPHIGHO2_01_FULL_43_35]OHA50123.1 MAG: hypothetical protein A3B75_01260 [Candidatus Terrybacteria bacterium RIFCSPHIGHO2_02_FULL_43_14]OHA51946.1 MAG: hypothetical protein A3A80_00250 [Candidatus Terrybacteria bacterium RIFCSPLOWO2_01_FULL_44_24]